MKKIKLYFIYTLIIMLGFSSCTPPNKEEPVVLTKLEIIQQPAKTVYMLNESLDLTGMIVKKIYSDGQSKEVSVTPAEVSGFDSSKPNKALTLTVTIEGVKTTFNVEITDATLVSLRVKKLPTQVIYSLGESLNLAGLEVVAVYSDGGERPVAVAVADVSGFSSAQAAENQALTITKGGKTTTFNVTIVPVKVVNGVLTEVPDAMDELVLPMSVKSIGEGVFANNAITKVVLNEGLESIGEDAFLNAKVKEITFPSTLKTIGQYAFYKSVNLTNVDLSKTKVDLLEEGTFGYSGVVDVKLPQTLTTIGAQAFLGTNALKEITLNEGLELLDIEAFRESGLVTIQIPNGIKIVGERAFYLCPDLAEVITYGGSSSVGTIDVVPLLGVSSFENCPKLTRLDIPEKIEIIGQNIISGNTGVASIIIPMNVRQINFAAFRNSRIKNVVVKAVVPPVADVSPGAWYGFPEDLESLKVPATSVDAYKQAVGWSDYANIIIAE